MLKIPHERDITILLDSASEAPVVAASVPPPFVYVAENDEGAKAAKEVFAEYLGQAALGESDGEEAENGTKIEKLPDVKIMTQAEMDEDAAILPPPFSICTGGTEGMARLFCLLADFGYKRVSRIDEPGDFSVRGDVVDIWSMDSRAFRIGFLDNQTESIREINPNTFAAVKAERQIFLPAHETRCTITTFVSVKAALAREYPIMIFQEGETMRLWHPSGGEFKSTETITANLFSERGEFVIPKIDSLVYHETRGLGKFVGVKTLDLGGQARDYIILQYERKTLVYVPADQTDLLYNYFGIVRRLDRI
jgi:transcription-repair coupling factor (superfamily II helicase)